MWATPSCCAISRRFAWSAFVLLRRSFRDDFQVRDFREPGENFILNAGREVSVRLIVAKTFERQDRDRFFLTTRAPAMAPRAEPVECDALFDVFARRNWNASKTAAITANATVIPTSFRPVLRGIDR